MIINNKYYMNLLLQRRRYIDKMKYNDDILHKSKYTILEQKYEYIEFIFHFTYHDNLYNYKISQLYINEDIDKIIKQYINEKININLNLKIKYHENHPFECPYFILEDVSNNLNLNINNKLKIYFNYIIDKIYKKLKKNWSPVLPMNVIVMYIYNLINIKSYFTKY